MTFTNMQYTEFDSTNQTLISDLLDKILLSASWSKISSTSVQATTTALSAAAATTLTFTSGVPAATFVVNQVIRIGEKGAADCEYRTITAIAATTVTVAALTYSHASGTNVYVGNEVLKATTTRGADMIVDLMDTHITPLASNLNLAAWKAHTGAVNGGTGRNQRYAYWRASAAPAATNIVHCIVSVSKEHLFISLEGPRYNETGAESATLGSSRNYFAIGDVVPYFGGDTVPVVCSIGKSVTGATGNFPQDLFVNVSQNAGATANWPQARLMTLANPANGIAGSMNFTRQTAGDGNWYLSPYVVMEDINGERGRLAPFHFAGYVNPDYLDSVVASPPIGAKVTYSSQLYKILAMNKTATAISQYGPFGLLSNASGSSNNVAIAVPCT